MKIFAIIFIILFSSTSISDTSLKNEKCFKKRIGIPVSDDVSDIHCDNGSVYQFQMTLKCNKETLKKIVDKLNLVKDKTSYSGLQHIFKEYDWWKHKDLQTIKNTYKSKSDKVVNDGPWYFLAYDESQSRLYLARYDL